MKSLNTKISLAGMTSFLLVAASLLGFSSVMPTVTATTATTDDDTTTTTTTSPQAGIIQLSPEPVYQERQIGVSETAINQTHVELANSGNGTLTLPNTTETISTTSTGSLIVSLDGNGAGKEVITTEDGSESVTATIYAIARIGMEGGRGITIALLDTDSTGRLAPLDGMILAGQFEFPPSPEEPALITLWEWQSGIPLPPPSPTPTEEPSPLTDTTTTTTTNTTTTADDTDATTALPEQGEGEEQ
ncbi:MAG: hypothetical protein M3275_02335 [Thermoproteota archaeon]|nr:hypothetical protein [Thermoproteota archaeon]